MFVRVPLVREVIAHPSIPLVRIITKTDRFRWRVAAPRADRLRSPRLE